MTNYRRLISYIYAYEGEVKGKNIGFAKLESFSNGILDLTVLLQYVSLAWLFVFVTIQAVEKRRWS